MRVQKISAAAALKTRQKRTLTCWITVKCWQFAFAKVTKYRKITFRK